MALTLIGGHALGQKSSQGDVPKSSSHSAPDPGQFTNNLYHNSWFGIACRVPYGWVDRTDTIRESDDPKTDPRKAMVLLAVFERPPEAKGSTVNSSIVIAAEATSVYPGIKTAAQYFGPLNEVISSQGLSKVNEPYEFPVDGKPIVRQDFIKKDEGVGLHQSTLAWLTKGYIVSFTFIASDDDQVQALVEGLKIESPHKNLPKPSQP